MAAVVSFARRRAVARCPVEHQPSVDRGHGTLGADAGGKHRAVQVRMRLSRLRSRRTPTQFTDYLGAAIPARVTALVLHTIAMRRGTSTRCVCLGWPTQSEAGGDSGFCTKTHPRTSVSTGSPVSSAFARPSMTASVLCSLVTLEDEARSSATAICVFGKSWGSSRTFRRPRRLGRLIRSRRRRRGAWLALQAPAAVLPLRGVRCLREQVVDEIPDCLEVLGLRNET